MALDAAVPRRTRLLVSTATSDAALEEAQIADLPASAWSAPLEIGPDDPPEILVQNSGGRYLWMRIEMFGDGTRTPRITGIDVFAPRRSSLHDLPPPFRRIRRAPPFLTGFSAISTRCSPKSAKHAAMPALFDPRAVPSGAFLDWLASWFDIAFLPEWPETTRRAMVAQAIAMYRRRGTVAGLRQILQWHTGLSEPAPAIIEHFRVSQPIVIAGTPLAPTPTTSAHAFTIVLPAAAAPDDTARSPSRPRDRGRNPGPYPLRPASRRSRHHASVGRARSASTCLSARSGRTPWAMPGSAMTPCSRPAAGR